MKDLDRVGLLIPAILSLFIWYGCDSSNQRIAVVSVMFLLVNSLKIFGGCICVLLKFHDMQHEICFRII